MAITKKIIELREVQNVWNLSHEKALKDSPTLSKETVLSFYDLAMDFEGISPEVKHEILRRQRLLSTSSDPFYRKLNFSNRICDLIDLLEEFLDNSVRRFGIKATFEKTTRATFIHPKAFIQFLTPSEFTEGKTEIKPAFDIEQITKVEGALWKKSFFEFLS